MTETNKTCLCTSYTRCECYEKWDLKQLGFWGFIKMLYAHHKPSGGALILRLALAFVFISEGWDKVKNFAGTEHFFNSIGFISPCWLYMVIIAELIGGICILLGILTKPACFALALEMAIIVFALPGMHGGFLGGRTYEFFLLLTLLALYIGGPGKYSLANLWLHRKHV